MDDYGLDGEAEEFSEPTGRGTGLRFYVQLKATDQPDLASGLRASIPLGTASYYRASPLPVLMVRYHGPSKQLYTRWFHEFDSYYGGVSDKALTFRWTETDVWDSHRPAKLVADARAFLTLRSSSLDLPLSFHLVVPADGVFGLTPTELVFAFRAASARRPDVIELARGEPSAGSAMFRLTEQELVADLAGVTSATLHYEAPYDPGSVQQIATDAMAMAALAFERIGQSDPAGRLTQTFFAESTVVAQPEAGWALSSAMARARQVTEALHVADALDQRSDAPAIDVSVTFTLPALFHSGSLTPTEIEQYRQTVAARIARSEARGDPIAAARACVTLGNHYRSCAAPRLAVPLYTKAARLDQAYKQRLHFWHELAGVLFGSGHYLLAADAYGRALELGDKPFAAALRADALMFGGHYTESLAAFSEFNGSNPAVGEWRLKEVFLAELTEKFGFSRQRRAPEEAQELAGSVASAADPKEAEATLRDALELDALCALAWFNLGRAHLDLGNRSAALFDYLSASLMYEGDEESWANAVLLSFEAGAHEMLLAILEPAYRFTGERLTHRLAQVARDQDESFPKEEFLQVIDSAIAELPDERDDGFLLRFPQEGADVDVVELKRAEAAKRPPDNA
jgi:tetratricopeptide (TPR) repeat protein